MMTINQVGKIEIKLSWTKLSSSPIEVFISDVFVVACPTTVVHLEEKDSGGVCVCVCVCVCLSVCV
jgi:hypothetical protein